MGKIELGQGRNATKYEKVLHFNQNRMKAKSRPIWYLFKKLCTRKNI